MKKFLLLGLFLLIPSKAKAVDQHYVGISSATFCSITVSSGATRVDNFNGACERLLAGRNTIKIINPTGNATINCGYTNSVSTQTVAPANNRLGEEITAGAKVELSLFGTVAYWCMSQAASGGSVISIQQSKPVSALGD